MTIGEREYEHHRQTTPNGKLAESYFDLAGVRGPVCEVIDAMAEDNDRLRRELEEAKAELARMQATRDAPRMCPWCHVIPQVCPDWTDCRRFRVDCTNDDCPVKPGCQGDSEEEAVAIWNGGV